MSERFLPVNGPATTAAPGAARARCRAADPVAVARRGRARDRRHRRHGPQPGRRRAARGRTALQRRAGLGDRLDVLTSSIERLAALPARERASVPGIKPARADLILAGAVVVAGRAARRRLRRPRGRPRRACARASSSSATGAPRAAAFEDVRRESVLNLAGQYHLDVRTRATSRARARDVRRARRPRPARRRSRERELFWAASILHDIGMSVDYDDHHKHSRYLILNAGLPGFTPAEVAIIAQAARYHRKGMPEPGQLRRCSARATGSAWTAARCCCGWPRTSSARATSSCAKRTDAHERVDSPSPTASRRAAVGRRRERDLFERAFGRSLDIAA